MFLRPKAVREGPATVPQSTEEPGSESETPLLCKRWESTGRVVMMVTGREWPKFSPYNSSQKLDEEREKGGKN